MFLRTKLLNSLYKQSFVRCVKVGVECSNSFPLKLCIPNMKFCSQTIVKHKINIKEENDKPVNTFAYRTHTCGELTIDNVNQIVTLCGWLQHKRCDKFIILRDSYGLVQCIIDGNLTSKFDNLPYETVLKITGKVIPRSKDQCNPNMCTGDIEVNIESYEILNLAMPQLPFNINKLNEPNESLQMQYRYLALRFPKLQKNLRLRSWVTMKMREYLIHECGFVDVKTPTLFRKTPGGAQEFIVATKHLGQFYSLTQSPQQFKQLLMVGGIDRYFQIAQCYRDEGSRSDRQPEFTQLDIEMSFVDKENVISLTENLIKNSWPEYLDTLQIPFPRLTYEESMETYGTDCPDLRIIEKIYNITKRINIDTNLDNLCIYGTVFRGKHKFLTKSVKQNLLRLAKQIFQSAKLVPLVVLDEKLEKLKLFPESIRKMIMVDLNLQVNDVLLISYGPKEDARQLLGKIRVEFTNILESRGEIIRLPGFKFVWIVDFPLFTINSETKAIEISHHPFTQPHPDDINQLHKNPLQVRGQQYDLVLNGAEIGGGSIRIHEKTLQKEILKILNIDCSEMYYLLEALNSGAPPHGGIAIGLDRYISMICGASSIREVIAFPKTMDGRDLMSGAPSLISDDDKKLYKIKILND